MRSVKQQVAPKDRFGNPLPNSGLLARFPKRERTGDRWNDVLNHLKQHAPNDKKGIRKAQRLAKRS